jgi:uncharacterized membrane protein
MNRSLHNAGYIKRNFTLTQYGIERLLISGVISWIFGLAVIVGLKSLGLPIIVAIPFTLLLIIAGIFLLGKRLPSDLIGIRKQKPLLSTLWLLLALVSVLQTTPSFYFYDRSSSIAVFSVPGR